MVSRDGIDLSLKDQALAFTSCGVTLSDARDPELPLIYVNRSFEEMTGYEGGQILGQNCRFLQRQDREQAALDDLRAALAAGKDCRVVLRNYRRDGSLFWNELTVSPILDEDQEISHFVGIQTDITLRERARQERERLLQELQTANRDLDDFAHIVSHDLRAPLRGVDTLSQMLLDQHSGDLAADGQNLVRLLDSRVKRLSALLEGVLRYSRARGEQPAWSEVETRRLVADMVDLLDIPERVPVNLSEDLPVIQSDATRLGQIFQNLLDNAAKFQPEEGGFIRVTGGETEDHWHFAVADGGPGIPVEHRERIFGMFQTVKSRDQLETTGVGLAVVQKAVQRLGGRIWVESEPGEGATFRFTVPKEPPPEVKRKGASPG